MTMPIKKSKFIWMDGEFVEWDNAKVHLLTHTLHYGAGVFEGIRCYATKKGSSIFRGLDHFKRLERSARAYFMKLSYSPEQLLQVTKELIRKNELPSCYIRPLVVYGYGEMGVNPLKNPINVSITVWEWGAYLGEEGLVKGIRVKTSSWMRIDPRILPTQAKACGNYMNSILAKVEALKDGYDEAIMLNMNGFVVEGTGENLFMVKDGVVYTPPLSSGCLPGITRDSVLQLCAKLGIPTKETDLTRDMLLFADEVFFTGTAAEITPIREIDGRVIGSGTRGPITEKLQKKFFALAKREEDIFPEWHDMVD